ncbi:YqaA family protein [Alloiococcus sp. CFN-8]|uniref:YqaA family protein n=1 Tax=Alloiococcus sp. CFN-8 TaxID=3416081 RepID=UPI003CEA6194
MDNLIKLLVEYGMFGIMLVAFAEAIFLPLPMEVVSIPIYLLRPENAFFYSVVLIAFSILGSIAGYYLGKAFGKPLLNKFISEGNFNRIKELYSRNSFLAILTSSFTPIPYEAYVLSAGVFNIGFKKFILASIISRAIRHLPQGILITIYGDTILTHLKSYTLVVCLVIFSALILIKKLLKRQP